ncbi:MAG: SusC/RagA family TonB-linked outer membrane protein [Ginsengibacter sp.]
MRKFSLFLLFTVISCQLISSPHLIENKRTFSPNQQSLTVKGRILSKSTGEPLQGANVLVKGSTRGTVSDVQGYFSISTSKNSTLIFSMINYHNFDHKVTKSDDSLMVFLAENVSSLGEVVVVGYGTQKKESVVGAISQVNSETLIKSGYSNITSALVGKMPGVSALQQSGEPGANAANITIRGLSSWNSSSPLVLVDGVERDFSNMDPNEIQTISVLKDASATAVFGAKGANGVIIVTTKRGVKGKAKLDFSGSYGMNKATGIPNHINSYKTMSMLNVARMNDQQYSAILSDNTLQEYLHPSSVLNSLQYPDVDWFKVLSQSFTPVADANLNISGGTDFVRYFSSFGFQHEGSYFKGYHDGKHDTRYKNDRFNYRGNVDFSLTKTTQLSLNLGGDVNIKNQPVTPGGVWETMYATGPARFPAYFPAWVLDQVPDRDYPDATGERLTLPFGERFGNPYSNFYDGSFRKYLGSKVFSDLILNQKLDYFLKGLSVRSQVSLSTYYRNLESYTDYSFPVYRLHYDRIGVDANGDGIVDKNPWERQGEGPEAYYPTPPNLLVGGLVADPPYYSDLYYEAALNYSNSFGNHYVTGLALWNRQQKNKGTDFPYYNEAFVGRATYDFSHKYLFEFNIGYTGSERFAPTKRYGLFPSAAVGWVISEEDFFRKSVPWMNRLKLRYSDGLVGSDYAANRWLYISDYTMASNGLISEDLGANASAQWEQSHKRDIGLEVGILDNMFTFTIDAYDEYRDKMLLSPRSVTILVGNSFKELNLGSLKKHGIEFEAVFNKTVSNNLNYFVKGNFSYTENRIISKDDLPYAPEYIKESGKPIDAMLTGVLLTNSGYFTSVDDLHTKSAPLALNLLSLGDYQFLDYNGDGQITALDRYPTKGHDYPPIIFSLSAGFSYKAFDFRFMVQGNVGKYVNFNQNFENEFLLGDYSVKKSQLNYWTPDNPGATHSTLHYFDGGGGIPQLSWGGGAALEGYAAGIENRFWRNADFIRLKDVFAAYTFKPQALKKIVGISNLQVYATVNNLITITNLIEGDPERVIEQTGDAKKYTYGYYPLMITAKLGVKVSF